MSNPSHKHVNLYGDPQLFSALETYAEKLRISRNQLIINLLESGLEDLRFLNSCGLLVMGRGFRDLVDKLRHGQIAEGEKQLSL